MNKLIKLFSWIKTITNILVDTCSVIYSLIFNLLFTRKIFDFNNVIVTAADKYYYGDLVEFLTSIKDKVFFQEIYVYDLGLAEDQIKNIKSNFPFANVIKFKFENYPSFVGIRDSDGKLGGYAWKPLIIKEVYLSNDKTVFWFDTGTRCNKLFINSLITIRHQGYFSTYSPGNIKDWTIESVIKKLNVPKKDLKKRNLNGAIVGFKYGDKKAKKLLDDWVNLSLKKELIVPNDNSRVNHRHDQSLLTILSYKLRSHFFSRNTFMYGLQIHQSTMRIIYIHDKFLNYEMRNFRENWYKKNQNISTNTFNKSKIVVFLNYKQFKSITSFKYRTKDIVIVLKNSLEVLAIKKSILRNKPNITVLVDFEVEPINDYKFRIVRLKLTEDSLKNYLLS